MLLGHWIIAKDKALQKWKTVRLKDSKVNVLTIPMCPSESQLTRAPGRPLVSTTESKPRVLEHYNLLFTSYMWFHCVMQYASSSYRAWKANIEKEDPNDEVIPLLHLINVRAQSSTMKKHFSEALYSCQSQEAALKCLFQKNFIHRSDASCISSPLHACSPWVFDAFSLSKTNTTSTTAQYRPLDSDQNHPIQSHYQTYVTQPIIKIEI